MVTLRAAGYLELPVPKECAVWKRDNTIVKPVAPENPVRKDMFIIEWYGLRACAANEAVIPLSYLCDEPLKAEILYAAFAVDH
jgi:hypothetical protein